MALEVGRPRGPSGSPAYPGRRRGPWAMVAGGRLLAPYRAERLTHSQAVLRGLGSNAGFWLAKHRPEREARR
jgi:hypothetical protein